jgi:prepilin-type N-terminal cleavage/methylation domain-containing protein/prepilin-type processing-associated H-X9-DG protein
MYCVRQRGFTLVEMLVVISLIGILSAALITQVTKVRETARGVKCKTNLKNLAQAALSYAGDAEHMPWAGSHEYVDAARSTGRMQVYLRRGWVDWTRGENLEHWPKSYSGEGPSMSGGSTMQTAVEGKAGYLSVTNGTLWSYMGRDLSTYVCAAQVSKYKDEVSTSKPIYRSYAMNCYFGYNSKQEPYKRYWRDIWLNSLSARGSSERLLLFAELAPTQPHNDTSRAADGVLETLIAGYNDGQNNRTKPEVLGFNHQVGRQSVAHVAYADGHVDVFHTPNQKGMSPEQMKGLVYFLCNGYDLPQQTTQWKIP